MMAGEYSSKGTDTANIQKAIDMINLIVLDRTGKDI